MGEKNAQGLIPNEFVDDISANAHVLLLSKPYGKQGSHQLCYTFFLLRSPLDIGIPTYVLTLCVGVSFSFTTTACERKPSKHHCHRNFNNRFYTCKIEGHCRYTSTSSAELRARLWEAKRVTPI